MAIADFKVCQNYTRQKYYSTLKKNGYSIFMVLLLI